MALRETKKSTHQEGLGIENLLEIKNFGQVEMFYKWLFLFYRLQCLKYPNHKTIFLKKYLFFKKIGDKLLKMIQNSLFA